MQQFKAIFLLVFITTKLTFCSKKDLYQAIPVSNTIQVDSDDSPETIILKAAHVVPAANQLEALKDEFIAFIHFGPNTFTRMEWGDGMEDPKVFDLKHLDTDQWCEAMKAAGMAKVILTVKHHDGFVLWQSRYTEHGIMSTNFQKGEGDILKDLSESCEKYGLKLGVYLSPADLYQIENKDGLYGNLSEYSTRTIPRPVEGRPFENKTTFKFEVDDYNEYFLNQLFELLTEYGPVHEVWFDGAHPKRKGNQQYNYLAWKELIRTLAPEAVIFGREDIRWCGNEAGDTRDTEWNVIPYESNPNEMTSFGDLTAEDLGSRERLLEAEYLHYQPAETNTSIREGWFYRDDVYQGVRSVDDVFDMYERSVGGNSIFLLNIPPNREGRFSQEDVSVLEQVGERIKDTYETNLLQNTTVNKELVQANNDKTKLIAEDENYIDFQLPEPIIVNRFVIQEDIKHYGERVEEHQLEAFVNGEWKLVAKATNIGYKRILRFDDVESDQFRLLVQKRRFTPAIQFVGAYYYNSPPPVLSISREVDGKVNIQAKKKDFGWKPHGHDAESKNLEAFTIRYTIDGSEPSVNSPIYTNPFNLSSGTVKAAAFDKENNSGSISEKEFGTKKSSWKLSDVSSEVKDHQAMNVFDARDHTYWQSNSEANQYVSFDFGENLNLKGFSYTPVKKQGSGMMAKGEIWVSQDGENWKQSSSFGFGNLINDPSTRNFYFEEAIETQFIRVVATEITGGDALTIAELDFYISD